MEIFTDFYDRKRESILSMSQPGVVSRTQIDIDILYIYISVAEGKFSDPIYSFTDIS